jgi:hypothetical protein
MHVAKLSISQAWDETKAVLTRDGKLIGAVALALFVLPGIVLDLVMPPAPAGQFPAPGPWMAVAAVAILISLTCQLAIIRLGMGPHLTVGDAIAHGARRLLPFVAAVLAWGAPLILVIAFLYASMAENSEKPSPAAALALIAIALVGIYLAVRFILMSAVASAENIGPLRILRRSWELSAGNWWRLFGFLLLFAAGALVLVWAVGAVTGLLSQLAFGSIAKMTPGGLIVIIVSQLVSALLYLTYFVMLARLYLQRSAGAHAGVPSSGI